MRRAASALTAAALRSWTLDAWRLRAAPEVWLNGLRLVDIKGAFTRGSFNVTEVLMPDRRNTIAVRIAPPPHPGIPHEHSNSRSMSGEVRHIVVHAPWEESLHAGRVARL